MYKSKARIALGSLVISMLLSSCSLFGKGSIPELQAICDGMRSRVVEIASNYPDEDSYGQADWMASLSGESDRESLRQKILRLMPYLADYDLADYDFDAYESGKLKQGSNDWRIKEAVLLMSKTPAPLVFNDEEKQKISIAGADAYEKVVMPKVEFYLGPSYRVEGETEADGCEELDDAAEPSIDYDNQVEYQWNYYRIQMNDYVDNYFWILSCKQTGKVEGEKCSGTKYVSTPTNSSSFCNERLKTTTNGAEPGVTCGKLRFRVFQADKNTGDCMALAWWNDKNGVQQVGAFYSCGLEEGLTYDEKVTVGNPTTYTNNFGAEKTVITFSLGG